MGRVPRAVPGPRGHVQILSRRSHFGASGPLLGAQVPSWGAVGTLEPNAALCAPRRSSVSVFPSGSPISGPWLKPDCRCLGVPCVTPLGKSQRVTAVQGLGLSSPPSLEILCYTWASFPSLLGRFADEKPSVKVSASCVPSLPNYAGRKPNLTAGMRVHRSDVLPPTDLTYPSGRPHVWVLLVLWHCRWPGLTRRAERGPRRGRGKHSRSSARGPEPRRLRDGDHGREPRRSPHGHAALGAPGPS